jgi:ABC-type multidrug transport system ATPase subunit
MYQRISQENPDDILIDTELQNYSTDNFNSVSPHPVMPNASNSQIQNSKSLSIQLTWKNLSSTVEETSVIDEKKVKKQKVILSNQSGTILPGQFLTIMGSTGAGKTTLLNILSGKTNSGNQIRTGTVLINGVPLDQIDYTPFTLFYQQNDEFMANLTIQECLIFAAKCKCSGGEEEIQIKVDNIMNELSLSHIKDEKIGTNISRYKIKQR